ncbi:MAG: zinc ribbon domain-containing protein [Spirochaetaceae bacterium]|nr:zinc ribbon domain-containing protein [Spirochaetaceae bacterium]
MADVSVPGLRTSPSCAAHSYAREARSGTPAAVLQSGAYKLSKFWQRLLCASLVLILLLTGCATTDTSDEVASSAESAESVLVAENVPETVVEPEIEPEPFYCPFCGAEIPEDSVFCHKCGEKIEDFGKEKPWHTPESLDELEGEWQNSELGVTINYPDSSLGTENRMFSFSWQEQDVTYLWQNYADSNGLSLDDIWEKRNAYRAMIHGDVRSDENGSQVGYVLRGDYYWDYYDGYTLRIYAQLKYFVPEKIVRDNIANFLVSPDGSKIKMTGTFRTFSDMNFTLNGTGTVYDKVIYDDWSPYWGEP